MIEIRKSTPKDLDEIYSIIDNAIEFMRKNGNKEQWNDEDGVKDKIKEDIRQGGSYVIVDGGQVLGTFAFYLKPDPTYLKIEGKWLNDSDYGVIHRTASSGKRSGMMDLVVSFCLKKTNHLRIDTHHDNFPMRSAVLRNGFVYCGVITLENGQLRDAFERI